MQSVQPYAKLFGVVAAVILFGAWLIEKAVVSRADKLRDAITKAEQDKESAERSFRTESRLVEVYQVAASARGYSLRSVPKEQPYLDTLYEDVERLERTGVARNFAYSLAGYSSRTKKFVDAIDPPSSTGDRVLKASKAVDDFGAEIDRRQRDYEGEQRQIVGEVINPNTITEGQVLQLSPLIRSYRKDIEFVLMPRFAPLANELFRAYDELFTCASAELQKRDNAAERFRWLQVGVYISGSVVAILGSYLDAAKPPSP